MCKTLTRRIHLLQKEILSPGSHCIGRSSAILPDQVSGFVYQHGYQILKRISDIRFSGRFLRKRAWIASLDRSTNQWHLGQILRAFFHNAGNSVFYLDYNKLLLRDLRKPLDALATVENATKYILLSVTLSTDQLVIIKCL